MLVLATLLALPMAPTTSPVEAKQRGRTVTRTFRNGVPITLPGGAALPSPVAAGYYPSDIAVAGLKGTIRGVHVRVNAFSHTWPDGVEPLLVRPCAQTAIGLADAGGTAKAEAVTLTMDDEAAPLPDHDALQSGSFRPTIASGPGEPLAFDGSGANGTRRIFIQDDYGPSNSGVVAGG